MGLSTSGYKGQSKAFLSQKAPPICNAIIIIENEIVKACFFRQKMIYFTVNYAPNYFGGNMKISAEQLRLYAVTDSSHLGGKNLADAVRDAIKGGATIVQYREKNPEKPLMLREAMEVRKVCREYSVPFIMNDSVDLALAVDADGVHLGLDDGDISEARKILGESKIIGASTHNAAEAIKAQALGADYLGCGAVFGSATKTNVCKISPDVLREVTGAVSIPVVAIGGITQENVMELRGCGLAGVAVVSALFSEENITEAAEKMLSLACSL